MKQASLEYGRPVPRYYEYKAWLEEAGFINVKEYLFKIPFNTWPKSKQLKEVAKYNFVQYFEGCEGLCVGLFTRQLKWQLAEIQVLCAKFRSEIKDKSIHSYQHL